MCVNLFKKTEWKWKYTVMYMYYIFCIWKLDKKKLYPSKQTDEETLTFYRPYNMHYDKITSLLLTLFSKNYVIILTHRTLFNESNDKNAYIITCWCLKIFLWSQMFYQNKVFKKSRFHWISMLSSVVNNWLTGDLHALVYTCI